jgi:hypothetical protein
MKKTFALLALIGILLAQPTYAAGELPGTLIGDGLLHSWTGASPHYTLVDETPCNGLGDYIYTYNVGNMDSFIVQSSATNTIHITKITITPCASKAFPLGDSYIQVGYKLQNGWLWTMSNPISLYGTTPTNIAPISFNVDMIKSNDSNPIHVVVKYVRGIAGARVSRMKVDLEWHYE